MLITGLFSLDFSARFRLWLRTTGAVVAPPRVSWALLYQLAVEKMPPDMPIGPSDLPRSVKLTTGANSGHHVFCLGGLCKSAISDSLLLSALSASAARLSCSPKMLMRLQGDAFRSIVGKSCLPLCSAAGFMVSSWCGAYDY